MNINENAWHVKVYDFFYSRFDRPKSLCPYFWKTFGAVLFSVAIIVWFAFMFTFLGYTLIIDSGISTFGIFTYPISFLIGATIIAVIMGVGFGAVYLFFKLKDKIKDALYKRRWNKINAKCSPDYVEPEPNLLVEFIKAKKEKICPTIKFTKE
ncbi:hypothetical protein CkP1_0107 [Citrobacter phage CkP1]|nr:hypothetical protein CkP1_0107 [Citrobacter phage CkP1]